MVLTPAFGGLSFAFPVDLQSARDGSSRLFVVEQSGRIRVFTRSAPGTVRVFLDLSSRVLYQANSEMGLLGLAFHPRFPEDDRFFVYYTVDANGRKGRLSSFNASGDGSQADPFSEIVLLEVDQPFANHNGGGLVFDGQGKLCLGLGDGGDAGDRL
ncbi:MAG: PQQ-dependent sugar dehydrogenase, partial [Synechococcaceae cyanobacterium]|nr:PQQ-dependent sugar dehydrogenase [Synechococcaceae cyanobacterium]